MKLTERGAFAIACDEALVPARYLDLAGVNTWGVGHTAAAGAPIPGDMAWGMPSNLDAVVREAWAVFERDVAVYAAEVVSIFGSMTPTEMSGWTMWHYNTGGAFRSSAVALWKRGDKSGAVRVMQSWNKVERGGRKVVSEALVERRAREAALILRGEYPNTRLVIYPTEGKGKVVWHPLATYDFSEWCTFLGRGVRPAPGSHPAKLRRLFKRLFRGGR